MRFIPSMRSLVFAIALLAISAASYAQMGVMITIAPPALPVYEQPLCPGDGYMWTPGYWGYADADYYWVPGTWVMAPRAGLLWTPAYWGWHNGGYAFNEGYWGEHVGFYGGVSYGYGYFGEGYEGGRWNGEHFYYNRSVTNVNIVNIHNVYNTTVIHNNESRVSYNGGNGGIDRRPTPQEETFTREKHEPPSAVQTQHAQTARLQPELRASANHGKPPIAATAKPGEFKTGTTEAKAAEMKGGENKAAENRAAESKGAENKAANSQPSENKVAADNKAAENKANKNEPEATRTAEHTPAPRSVERPAPAHEASAGSRPGPKQTRDQNRPNPKPKANPKSEPKKAEGEPKPAKPE